MIFGSAMPLPLAIAADTYLTGKDVAKGVGDLVAGRVRRLDRASLDELLPASRSRTSTSS